MLFVFEAKSHPTPTLPCQRGGSKAAKAKRPPLRMAFLLVRIGGRYKDRTCDPFHVKEVLYR